MLLLRGHESAHAHGGFAAGNVHADALATLAAQAGDETTGFLVRFGRVVGVIQLRYRQCGHAAGQRLFRQLAGGLQRLRRGEKSHCLRLLLRHHPTRQIGLADGKQQGVPAFVLRQLLAGNRKTVAGKPAADAVAFYERNDATNNANHQHDVAEQYPDLIEPQPGGFSPAEELTVGADEEIDHEDFSL